MLSDEWIMDMVSQQCTAMLDGNQKEISPITIARAVEAEVRKQDDALIQQMHDALCECAEDSQEQLDRMEAAKLRQYKPQAVAYQEATIDAAKRAITAARARLGEKT